MKKVIQYAETFRKNQDSADRSSEKLGKTLGGVNTAAEKAKGGVSGLVGKLTTLVSTGYLVKKTFDLVTDSVQAATKMQVQETTFGALLGSKQAGSALYDYTRAYGRQSALGPTEAANATTSFLAYTKNIGQIEKLLKLTERLYMKDPTQGASGAVFALKELLSGDTMSVKDRFNMSGISGETIRNFANSGDIDGMIEYLDTVFNKFGATQEVVDANFYSLSTQASIFKENLKAALGDEGAPLMQNLAVLVRQLNEDMQAGKFQPFFDTLGGGMQLLGNLFSWVAQNADTVIPVIGGVAAGLVVLNTVSTAATMIQTIFGITLASTKFGLIGIAAGAVTAIAAVAALSSAFDEVNAKSGGLGTDLEAAKSAYANSTAGMSVPVELTNEDPVKVSGTVDIEEESMKYALDVAGKKWISEFSAQIDQRSTNVSTVVIEKPINPDEFGDALAENLKNSRETEPEGSY